MIDPLRVISHESFPLLVERPYFCEVCLTSSRRKRKPRLATKYCNACVKHYLCRQCDMRVHRIGDTIYHLRHVLVVGPGIRKKILFRGDAYNFPVLFDRVQIEVRSKIFERGQLVHTAINQRLTFLAGCSGDSVHAQILSLSLLSSKKVAPFVKVLYCGRVFETTRVGESSMSPRWISETIALPISDKAGYPRNMFLSKRNIYSFEVYRSRWPLPHKFVGYVEIDRNAIRKTASISGEDIVSLPLRSRSVVPRIGFICGLGKSSIILKILFASDLSLSIITRVYANVFLGSKLIGRTSYGTPRASEYEWLVGNEFEIPLTDVIDESGSSVSPSGDAIILSIELFGATAGVSWLAKCLGRAALSLLHLQRLLPSLATAIQSFVASSPPPSFSSPSDLEIHGPPIKGDSISAKLQSLEGQVVPGIKSYGEKPTKSFPFSFSSPVKAPSTAQSPPRTYSNNRAVETNSLDIFFSHVTENRDNDSNMGALVSESYSNVSNVSSFPQLSNNAQDEREEGLLLHPRQDEREHVEDEGDEFEHSKGDGIIAEDDHSERVVDLAVDVTLSCDVGMNPSIPPPSSAGYSYEDELLPPSKDRKFKDYILRAYAVSAIPFAVITNRQKIERNPSEKAAESYLMAHLRWPIGDVRMKKTSLVADHIVNGEAADPGAGSAISSESKPLLTRYWSSISGVWPLKVRCESRHESMRNDPLKMNNPTATNFKWLCGVVATSCSAGAYAASSSCYRAAVSCSQSLNTYLLINRFSWNGKRRNAVSQTLGVKTTGDVVWSDTDVLPLVLEVPTTSTRFICFDCFTRKSAIIGDAMKERDKERDDDTNTIEQGQVIGSLRVRFLACGRGDVINGLDFAVRQMTLGEKSSVKVRYDCAYNSLSVGDSIGPRSNIIFDVTLLEINGRGRTPILLVRSAIRFLLRSQRRVRRKIRHAVNYFRNKRPILRFLAPCLNRLFGLRLFVRNEDEKPMLMYDVDENEESSDDSYVDNLTISGGKRSPAASGHKGNKKGNKHLSRSALLGTDILWSSSAAVKRQRELNEQARKNQLVSQRRSSPRRSTRIKVLHHENSSSAKRGAYSSSFRHLIT